MWYFRLAVIFVISSLGIQPSTSAEKRPNIVIILADDFGVGDIQTHYPRNKIATPYLDRLVQQGMSFTDAHSPSAVCSPTRYGPSYRSVRVAHPAPGVGDCRIRTAAYRRKSTDRSRTAEKARL
jgi:hypothetical protein